MTKRNHYEILGVSRTEDESGIKTAFRRLAKRYHPDLSGPEETRRFQAILEAYEVLSDPESRASYNRSLGARDAPPAASRAGPRPSEPMEETVAVRSPGPWAAMSRGEARRGSFPGTIFDLFSGTFTDWGPGSRGFQRRRTLHAEIVLSEAEAARGGVLRLRHPGLRRCRSCGRAGLDEFLVCSSCHSRGVADDRETFPVKIPAGVQDGSTFEFAIDDPDESGLVLRVHIRVSGP